MFQCTFIQQFSFCFSWALGRVCTVRAGKCLIAGFGGFADTVAGFGKGDAGKQAVSKTCSGMFGRIAGFACPREIVCSFFQVAQQLFHDVVSVAFGYI